MIRQSLVAVKYFALVMLSVSLCSSCNLDRSIPVGSRAQTDSTLVPKAPLFESGRLAEALHHVDSVFYGLPRPTLYDYLSHYGTNAYVNSISGNYLSQLKFIDSGIALVSGYLPSQELSVELANLLIGRGEAHFNLKDYQASFDDYFEAMKVAKQYSDNCSIMRVVYNIAMILYKQQQWQGSAQYFMESLRFIEPCEKNIAYRNNKEQEVLDNIGLCYTKLKKYDSAMYYYRKALAIVVENPYKLAVDSVNSLGRYRAAAGVITGNMAKIYVGTNRLDSAIVLYRQAIAYNEGYDIHDMQLCLIQLSDVYLLKRDLLPMRQTLEILRASLNTVPGRDLEMDYDRLRYAYHQQTQEPAKALLYLSSYMQKKDSALEQQKQLQESDIGSVLKDKEQQFEIQLLQKNNQLNRIYLWVLVAFSVMGIIIFLLIYASYRSSKKNVQKLTELNAAITQANREKDRILRVVAHDLRNPIGGISSLSLILLSSDMDREKTREFLRKIESASTSSIALINELLQGQQNAEEQGEKVVTDIGSMLQHAVFMMQFKATEKGQQIKLSVPEQRLLLLINPIKTERVINNLIANAIKFSPMEDSIEVALQLVDGHILVSVKDHGIGISPENLVQVFDQFTSLKRIGTAGEKSFGLGLSICKQIIEEQGGKIWVESSVGEGSVFYVQLPANA